jgi:MFS transporter, OCT family, solute carrier family 22 (organic cation transporter), member 4/5
LEHYISEYWLIKSVTENAWEKYVLQGYLNSILIKGRLPVLVIAYIISFIGNILTIFSTTVPTFSIFRFVAGLATDSNFVMMYILVMEYIRPSMRTFGLNICIGVFYCLGSAITPWIAVWLGDWKVFLLATAIPALIVPCFYFIIPESAQWLIAKRETSKAIHCFKRIAKINGRPLSNQCVEEFEIMCNTNYEQTGKVNPSMLGLFKTPRLRRNTLILFFKS